MPVVLVADDDRAFREHVGALPRAAGDDVRLVAAGYDVLGGIRQTDGGPGLPVVMVTSAAGEAQRWQAGADGVDFLLAKPIDAEHLVRVVDYLSLARCHG